MSSVKEIIAAIIEDNMDAVKTHVYDVLDNKAADVLAIEKIAVAKTLFGNKNYKED